MLFRQEKQTKEKARSYTRKHGRMGGVMQCALSNNTDVSPFLLSLNYQKRIVHAFWAGVKGKTERQLITHGDGDMRAEKKQGVMQ